MKKGFTLIELLVVVAIISLLSSVVFASLNSARGRARNSNRLQSVKTLMNVFALSISGSNSFPTTGGAWVCLSTACSGGAGAGWGGFAAGGTATHTFLGANLPAMTDPIGGNKTYWGYIYHNPLTVGGVTGAWISYVLESPPQPCGYGAVVDNQVGLGYTQCYVKID